MALFSSILSRGYTALICRNFHASSALKANEFKKFKFLGDGYYKMGLYHDDVLNEYDKDIAEAIRRLPEEIRLQRIYRAIRAHQAELNNTLLPKELWTSFEDENHYYLQPYIREVVQEREERELWEATH